MRLHSLGMLPTTVPLSHVLPHFAANLLRCAAATEPLVAAGESDARTVALEAATVQVKSLYPQFFRKDSYDRS